MNNLDGLKGIWRFIRIFASLSSIETKISRLQEFQNEILEALETVEVGTSNGVKILNKGIKTHSENDCEKPCCIHAPSDHHMKTWPIFIRFDRHCLAERICEHGVGHPDPDSLAWFNRYGIVDDGTHGCDGCCQEPK